MAQNANPVMQIDQHLPWAAARFAQDIGALSANLILREGMLRAAICALTKVLEVKFDGCQDVLATAFREQAEQIEPTCDFAPDGLFDQVRNG